MKLKTFAGIVCIGTLYSGLHAQQSNARSAWDGVYTQEQSKKGQAAYNENCSSCHGDTLGGQDVAPALVGEISCPSGMACR